MKHYTQIVDEALGQQMSKFRTLRTCLDPGSAEWTETTMEKKAEILRKVSEKKTLQLIFKMYKKEYRDMNKPHVADSLEDGLTEMLNYFLSKG